MTLKEKLIRKVESKDSKKSLSFKELVKYIEHYGFEGKETKSNGGSHFVFRHSRYEDIEHIVLPLHKDPMLMVYRNKCIKGVKEVKEREREYGKL